MLRNQSKNHKKPYKILHARLLRDGDITTLKVRMQEDDIKNQFLKLEGYDVNTEYEKIKLVAYVAPHQHLDIRPTDILEVKLPSRKQTDGVMLRRKKRDDHSGKIDYGIVYVQSIPTRSKTSNMMHRAVVTVTLESRLD